jgi:hypothetical protein
VVAADADRRPLVLGEGKRLFENGVLPRGLSLVATRSTPRGVLLNTYRPPVPFHNNVLRIARGAEETMQARREFLDAIIVHYDTSMHNLRPKNII